MKKLLLILLTSGLIAHSQAQGQDEIDIKKLTSDFERVFNQKDPEETAKFWAEDGDYVTHLGSPCTDGKS